MDPDGLLLCDPEGSGKTLTALTLLASDEAEHEKLKSTVIVVPDEALQAVSW